MLAARRQIEPELPVLGAGGVGRIDEHAVMPPFDLVEPVAHRLQKVVVGTCDDAIEPELDHGLHAADRRDLPLVVGIAQLGFGDVGRVLDHFERLALLVDDRTVDALDVNLASPFADPTKLAGDEFAAIEPLPHIAVLSAARVVSSTNMLWRLPFDLLQRVTHRLQENVVGTDDRAVQLELDHRLRTLDGCDLAGVIEFQPLPVSDIFPGDDVALHLAICCRACC